MLHYVHQLVNLVYLPFGAGQVTYCGFKNKTKKQLPTVTGNKVDESCEKAVRGHKNANQAKGSFRIWVIILSGFVHLIHC